MDVKITGFASAEFKVWTVSDLRQIIQWCDKHRVSGECGVDYSEGFLFIDLTGPEPATADMIECGDHIPPNMEFDVIINTHAHEGPEDKEKFYDIPEYDWVTRDRYNDPGRPE